MRTFAAHQNDTAAARYEDDGDNLDPTQPADAKRMLSTRGGAKAAKIALAELWAQANEVAARECDYYAKSWDDLKINGSSISVVATAIRALATPDQTAALDRLIAEAEARVLERAAIIANKLLVRTKFGNDTLTEVVYSDFVGAAILAASKKGGA